MDIKSKLAKLLRLQESSNANEAANAAAFVEKLCREHGISPNEIDREYDPEVDAPIHWVQGGVFYRVDNAAWTLLAGVASYFNGRTVQRDYNETEDGLNVSRNRRRQRVIEVCATKSNKIQIELYYEYLMDVMDNLADEAKEKDMMAGNISYSFRQNFRKGFAAAIRERLAEMKYEAETEGDANIGAPGLVVRSKNQREWDSMMTLFTKRHPRLSSSNRQTFGGSGTAAGMAAGRATGLNKQMRTNNVRRLSAGWS